jgi:predicted nucleic acid-binding protein
MKRIFIDTSAWIALNSKKDMHFDDAINANKSFLNDGFTRSQVIMY